MIGSYRGSKIRLGDARVQAMDWGLLLMARLLHPTASALLKRTVVIGSYRGSKIRFGDDRVQAMDWGLDRFYGLLVVEGCDHFKSRLRELKGCGWLLLPTLTIRVCWDFTGDTFTLEELAGRVHKGLWLAASACPYGSSRLRLLRVHLCIRKTGAH